MEIDYDFRKSQVKLIKHTRFGLIVNQTWKTAIIFLIGMGILFTFYQILYFRFNIPILPGLINGSPKYWAEILAMHRYENWEFPRFLWEYLSGDWGRSLRISRQVSVMDLIKSKFPITLEVLFYSYFLTIILLPRLARLVHKRKYLKPILLIFSTIFVIGIIFQFIGIKLGWVQTIHIPEQRDLPDRVTGLLLIDFLLAGDFSRILVLGFLNHMILPVITLTLYALYLGLYKNNYKVSVTEQKVQLGYLAKGFPMKKEPGISNPLFFQRLFSQMLCGAILTEVVFNLRGIGMLLVDALKYRDFPLIIAIIYCFFVLELMMNLGNVIFRSKSYMLNYSIQNRKKSSFFNHVNQLTSHGEKN